MWAELAVRLVGYIGSRWRRFNDLLLIRAGDTLLLSHLRVIEEYAREAAQTTSERLVLARRMTTLVKVARWLHLPLSAAYDVAEWQQLVQRSLTLAPPEPIEEDG